MELHFDAVCRNKDAVSFKEIEHKAVWCYYSATVDAEQCMEGVFFSLIRSEFHVHFSVEKESFDLIMLASAQ